MIIFIEVLTFYLFFAFASFILKVFGIKHSFKEATKTECKRYLFESLFWPIFIIKNAISTYKKSG